MEKFELAQLEDHIHALKTAHSALGDSRELDELWQVIHRPGWTTPAEWMLMTTSLEYLTAQTKLLVTMRQNLLASARAVGKSQAAGA